MFAHIPTCPVGTLEQHTYWRHMCAYWAGPEGSLWKNKCGKNTVTGLLLFIIPLSLAVLHFLSSWLCVSAFSWSLKGLSVRLTQPYPTLAFIKMTFRSQSLRSLVHACAHTGSFNHAFIHMLYTYVLLKDCGNTNITHTLCKLAWFRGMYSLKSTLHVGTFYHLHSLGKIVIKHALLNLALSLICSI